MTHLVSIIVPAWNAQAWIADTLESALAQSWRAKEVIVVDDGSTDETLRIARDYESRDVRVITQPNGGAAAARNTGLRAAQGSYIQFLDADDLLYPDKIACQLRHADDGRHARTLLTGAWGRFLVRPDRACFVSDRLWQDLAPVDWIVTKFVDNRFMFPGAWLVSRRLAELAGPWNEQLSLDDDGEYMCRLVAASDRVHFVPDAHACYRVGNPRSLSARKGARALCSQYASIQLCIDHLLALEDSERTRSACVRLLQDNLAHFYPEATELVEQIRTRARSLGGELLPPPERAHFHLLRSVIGWRAAKQLRRTLAVARLRWQRTLDQLPVPH